MAVSTPTSSWAGRVHAHTPSLAWAWTIPRPP
jgi:hypothetical protein